MSNIGDKVHHPHDIWINHFPEMEGRWGRGKDLSITSMPNLNNKIWGLRKKSLVVVGGRPSNGKSVTMLQLAWDFAKQGKRVYFFTLEMTKESCVERLFCNEQEIDNFLITTGKFTTLTHLPYMENNLREFNNKINKDNLVFIEGFGKSFGEINEVIRQLGDVDAVFIDYLQMIKDTTSTKAAIDEYLKDLRNYAIEKDFCAIVGSQINRSSHDKNTVKEPELWELKSSGAIEEICDLAMLVHWKYHYQREDETEKENYIIRVAKNRSGRTGRFTCRFQPQYCKLSEFGVAV